MSESIRAKMAKGEANLDQERLKQVIAYCPDTGAFTWLRTGSAAGSIDGRGYLLICVDGRKYRAHRLAWLWVHGKFPNGIIDHRNCIRADNPINNLRDTTKTVNQQNQRAAFKNNRLGIRGVRLNRTGTGYETRLCVNKKFICLGTYKTAEEAHAVYVAAKRQHHEGCTL